MGINGLVKCGVGGGMWNVECGMEWNGILFLLDDNQ